MKKSKGFTLIELMIVVAIIGILSAIAIPKFADLIRKSNEGATKGNLGTIRSAISIYYGDMEGLFPSGSDPSSVLTMANGKYLQKIPQAKCPPYHAGSNSFSTQSSSGDVELGTPGSWAYQENRLPGTTEKPWGDVWVNCTHTDTKNNTWSQY